MKTQPATGETYPKSDLFNKARGSVRANDQIAMLKEISEKQSAQIDLLIALAHKKEEPEKDYLEEARKKAGLI
ncbi:TPA: YebO family protein [Klebsiella pneumoniae]